ncbi:signal peptidase I [Candidatus Woesearchaeota archaeon]|nr:signal peptidase I [Candidatus Woesearchaeota archaeon]
MKRTFIILLAAVFLLGFLASTAISEFQTIETPRVFTITGSTTEQPSPSDWIKTNQIEVYDDMIIIRVENATWAAFADTNSMDPFLDEGSNGIEITPESPDQINVGDIIAYKTSYGTIIHRVVEKGEDEEGIYFMAKGDNNNAQDPNKIRFEQIERVLVAIIY